MAVNSLKTFTSSWYRASYSPVEKNRGVGVANAVPMKQMLGSESLIPVDGDGERQRAPHVPKLSTR
jgi:hypothetical protein